jgi:DNA-binding HxlR family transcriptional regulator
MRDHTLRPRDIIIPASLILALLYTSVFQSHYGVVVPMWVHFIVGAVFVLWLTGLISRYMRRSSLDDWQVRVQQVQLEDWEVYVLQHLESGPKFGAVLLANSGGLLKRGHVYVRLARMEEANLITGETLTDRETGRRLYHLTEHGTAALRAYRELQHSTEVTVQHRPSRPPRQLEAAAPGDPQVTIIEGGP